jgi:hypothetical protein
MEDIYFLKSPHQPIGEYSAHDVYYKFYISSGLVDSCQMILALRDPTTVIPASHTLKTDWMLDIENVVLNKLDHPKACGAETQSRKISCAHTKPPGAQELASGTFFHMYL